MTKWFSVTFTAEIPRCRSVGEPSGFTRCNPGVSGTTAHAAPAGTEPIGSPLASSVTNSSPSPPRGTLGAPTASPILSSASAPGTAGGTRGPGQATAAGKSRLTIQSLDQRPVELLDGVVDVRIRVRAGDEPCLEGR